MTISNTSEWLVGSDFDASSVVVGDGRVSVLPALHGEDRFTLVESGRQALALVIKAARRDGYDTVLFPAHYCESMLTPFLRESMRVVFAPVDDAWQLCPPARDQLIPERTLIYSLSYFGVPESRTWIDFVDALRDRRSKLLSDETHRLLDRADVSADWRIASLRKMLPVPDGAFVTGVDANDLLPSGLQGHARWEAMQVKALQLREGCEARTYLELFGEAESITEKDHEPAAASDLTQGLMAKLDYAAMRDARQVNAQALCERMAGSRFRITTTAAETPSHHVITGDAVSDLRAHLISEGVFPPVHWPPPQRAQARWRTDIVSIPVDHRYGASDMWRVAQMIRKFEREVH